MDFLESWGKEIVSLLVPVLTWALGRFFGSRAKLEFSNPHAFRFTVQEPLRDPAGAIISPTQTVHTRSLVCRNTGKVTLTRVEWVFHSKPQCLNVWPPRQYFHRDVADGRHALLFPSLAPGEAVGAEVLAINANVPDVLTVRSDQCLVDWVTMAPQRVVERWRIRVLLLLAFAGLGVLVYATILLLQWLILLTPVGR
jgi:hypothetical protein